MHDLAALTPLGAATPKAERIGTILISEVTDRALASVSCRAGRTDAFHLAASAFFGADLPGPGSWSASNALAAIWTGPEQWFLEAPFGSHEDITRIVKAALGDTASVTEQTDGWVRFDVEGRGVIDLMERLCPVPSRRKAPPRWTAPPAGRWRPCWCWAPTPACS